MKTQNAQQMQNAERRMQNAQNPGTNGNREVV